MLEKVLFIKKLFLLVPLPIPGPTPPAIGLAVHHAEVYRSRDLVAFLAQGVGIAELHVQVYGLNGRVVFDSGRVRGQRLSWRHQSASGVYLYRVTVRGTDGSLARSKLLKLPLLK